jgi:hypothetical protein
MDLFIFSQALLAASSLALIIDVTQTPDDMHLLSQLIPLASINCLWYVAVLLYKRRIEESLKDLEFIKLFFAKGQLLLYYMLSINVY